MAIITGLIPKRGFELIRDRIGEVIADEFANQATLDTNELAFQASVFVERSTPMDKTERSINVSLAKRDPGLMTTQNSQDGYYEYHIDCYSSSPSSSAYDGNAMASITLHRMTGAIHCILTDSRYNTLGFSTPFIENVNVSSIQFADPLGSKDASSVMMGRITVIVRYPDKSNSITPILINGYQTSVFLSSTSLGYVFSNQPSI